MARARLRVQVAGVHDPERPSVRATGGSAPSKSAESKPLGIAIDDARRRAPGSVATHADARPPACSSRSRAAVAEQSAHPPGVAPAVKARSGRATSRRAPTGPAGRRPTAVPSSCDEFLRGVRGGVRDELAEDDVRVAPGAAPDLGRAVHPPAQRGWGIKSSARPTRSAPDRHARLGLLDAVHFDFEQELRLPASCPPAPTGRRRRRVAARARAANRTRPGASGAGARRGAAPPTGGK